MAFSCDHIGLRAINNLEKRSWPHSPASLTLPLINLAVFPSTRSFLSSYYLLVDALLSTLTLTHYLFSLLRSHIFSNTTYQSISSILSTLIVMLAFLSLLILSHIPAPVVLMKDIVREMALPPASTSLDGPTSGALKKSKRLSLYIPEITPMATLRSICTALHCHCSNAKGMTIKFILEVVYSVPDKSKLYDLKELSDFWYDPDTVRRDQSQQSQNSQSHRPPDPHMGDDDHNVEMDDDTSFQLQEVDVAYLQELVYSLQEDLCTVSGAVDSLEDRSDKVESRINKVEEITEQALTSTEKALEIASSLEAKQAAWEAKHKDLEELSKRIQSQLDKPLSVGTETLRTVEYLDANARMSCVVVFGWPVNADGNEDFEADAPNAATQDALSFLERIGAPDSIGEWNAMRRGVVREDDPEGVWPTLAITFENQFKAREIIRTFLRHKSYAHEKDIAYNARIDTTLNKRKLLKSTQMVIDVLRAEASSGSWTVRRGRDWAGPSNHLLETRTLTCLRLPVSLPQTLPPTLLSNRALLTSAEPNLLPPHSTAPSRKENKPRKQVAVHIQPQPEFEILLPHNLNMPMAGTHNLPGLSNPRMILDLNPQTTLTQGNNPPTILSQEDPNFLAIALKCNHLDSKSATRTSTLSFKTHPGVITAPWAPEEEKSMKTTLKFLICVAGKPP
ncbi:hypothetical protein DFH27DRAFT_652930 [Peziza echinospora]|nr:hypothetical protein DFH27DRAFT_652930 [Peziza echinospora]